MNRKKKLKQPPCHIKKYKRIVCIGDLHGDYDALIISLRKAKVIRGRWNRWVGGDTIIVQMGDQVDGGGRGEDSKIVDSEMKIMKFLMKLHNQAIAKGGGVYCLLGNHELMNVMGDFRYVSKEGAKKFDGLKNRHLLFKPGGEIAIFLAQTRNCVLKVGDWLFVHGGINMNIAQKYTIDQMNNFMRLYLVGKGNLINNSVFEELYDGPDSLLWSREMSKDSYSDGEFREFYNIMKTLDVKGIVVGHTPQENGINSICKGRIWRIDVGMSNAYGENSHKNIQLLEIMKGNNGRDNIRIIK